MDELRIELKGLEARFQELDATLDVGDSNAKIDSNLHSAVEFIKKATDIVKKAKKEVTTSRNALKGFLQILYI